MPPTANGARWKVPSRSPGWKRVVSHVHCQRRYGHLLHVLAGLNATPYDRHELVSMQLQKTPNRASRSSSQPESGILFEAVSQRRLSLILVRFPRMNMVLGLGLEPGQRSPVTPRFAQARGAHTRPRTTVYRAPHQCGRAATHRIPNERGIATTSRLSHPTRYAIARTSRPTVSGYNDYRHRDPPALIRWLLLPDLTQHPRARTGSSDQR